MSPEADLIMRSLEVGEDTFIMNLWTFATHKMITREEFRELIIHCRAEASESGRHTGEQEMQFKMDDWNR